MNIIPSRNIHDASRPDLDGIKKASSLLKSAKHPVMIVGDRVSDDQAVEQAVELAELLGLPVYQSGGAEVSFPTDHPQYLGLFSLGVTAHRELLKNVDLVLSVGMDVFQDVFYWGDVLSDSSVKLVHIDSVANKVGQAEPTDVGIVSHCGLALHELINSLKLQIKDNYQVIVRERLDMVGRQSEEARISFEDAAAERWNNVPMTPERMMAELANAMPQNAIVVDDAISHSGSLRHYVTATKRQDIRGVRGASIGGGIGATMGTQCANPDRPVFGIIGDGSAMMTIQGLWTAANDDIPCIFVICNNGMYRVLRVNFDVYQREILKESEPAGHNLLYSDFPIPFDMATIAAGMGVHGERILDPSEIGPAVNRALASKKPALLDIVIDGSLQNTGKTIGSH